MATRPPLKLGARYRVRVTKRAFKKMPRIDQIREMQLIDKLDGRTLLMAEDVTVWEWDRNEYGFNEAMRGDCKKWPVIKTRFRKVKRTSVIELVEEPAHKQVA